MESFAMTDRTKALDELIAGDADLYDVPVTQADRDAAAFLVKCGAPGLGNGNKVMASEIVGKLHDNYEVAQAFARHRIASARITGDKDRRVSQSSAPTDAKIKALVEAVRRLNLRELVAGWNGENRADGPYEPHPDKLGVTLRTNAGTVYAIDTALAAFEGDA
jgi:hypothetical protein